MNVNESWNEVQRDLLALADLLKDKKHWCQGPMAADMYGRGVHIQDKDATRWCLIGGAAKVVGVGHPSYSMRSLRMCVALEAVLPRGEFSPSRFNDDYTRTTHQMVLDLIMRAVVYAGQSAINTDSPYGRALRRAHEHEEAMRRFRAQMYEVIEQSSRSRELIA